MKLNHGLHLAYCTNIHPAETWAETLAALQDVTLAVRGRVCPTQPFGIGLRLSRRAAQELSDPPALRAFRQWLDQRHCYVFTINGFPYGQFHGGRVKEQVYAPDWTQPERLEYTKLLFDLLSRLVPPGIEGSVSTLPGSFKPFLELPEEMGKQKIRNNLWHAVEYVARLSQQTERRLHLGLEPEPLCVLENTRETILLFERLRAEHPNDPRLSEHLGVTYDTCHFAVEFEEPQTTLDSFRQHHIKISKIHLSNALKLRPTPEALDALRPFADDVYLHQVAIRTPAVKLKFYKDLVNALAHEAAAGVPPAGVEGVSGLQPLPPSTSPIPGSVEWRVHFHIPLHAPATPPLDSTADDLLGVLDVLGRDPTLCSHLEMETYTWEVLPPQLRERSMVDQLVAEYAWTLARLAERGLVSLMPAGPSPGLGVTAPATGAPALQR